MHAEMEKKASRDTCSSSSAPLENTSAVTGVKAMTVCVLTTPACLSGRMASMWSSRWRPAISTSSADRGNA